MTKKIAKPKKVKANKKTIKIKLKIFSSIIESNNRIKQNYTFKQDKLKKMIEILNKEIHIKKQYDNEIDDFINKFKSYIDSNSTISKSTLKKTKIFNNDLLIKIIENPQESLTIKEIKEEYLKTYPNQKFSDYEDTSKITWDSHSKNLQYSMKEEQVLLD